MKLYVTSDARPNPTSSTPISEPLSPPFSMEILSIKDADFMLMLIRDFAPDYLIRARLIVPNELSTTGYFTIREYKIENRVVSISNYSSFSEEFIP